MPEQESLKIHRITHKPLNEVEPIEGESIENARDIAKILLAISTFHRELGFIPIWHDSGPLVDALVYYSKTISMNVFNVEPGNLGIIRVYNPDRIIGSQDTWIVLPLAYQRIGIDGLLYGIFIDQDEATGLFQLQFKFIAVRNSIITGVA